MQKGFNGYEILTFFYRTLVNCSTEKFQRTPIQKFWFNHRFFESSCDVEIVKRAQHYVLF